jgi:Zn-dependent protease
MRSGTSVGVIRGIQVAVDPSVLILFVLIAWQLGSGLFPGWHPEWSHALDWSVAILAASLFFGSILLHELAHSLAAQARGIPVRRIVLFLFGGVSDIQREPTSPGDEFLIAVVGPVTSLALGILFTLLGDAGAHGLPAAATLDPAQAYAGLSPISTLLMWLGSINIALGIFNLIPGFPLDGGRILRSLLWAATGNLRRATRMATAIGHGIAWAFIAGGLVMICGATLPFFGTGLFNGLWLIFIGWFLHHAAVRSDARVEREDG